MQEKLRVLDLFAGAGGFTLAAEMAGGYETVAFCEIDKYAKRVLRTNWPDVPLFDDVTKLRGAEVGAVDVITGGFPCQDLSSAGRGAGLGGGTRSGLFREMLRLADECGRPYIVFENVTRLLSGPAQDPGAWFGEFLNTLASIGYDAEWFCVSAGAFGGPHERKRVCVVAYPDKAPVERGGVSRRVYAEHAKLDRDSCWWGRGRGPERRVHRVDDGVSMRSHRIRSGIMGNAIVPPVFAVVMRALREAHGEAMR